MFSFCMVFFNSNKISVFIAEKSGRKAQGRILKTAVSPDNSERTTLGGGAFNTLSLFFIMSKNSWLTLVKSLSVATLIRILALRLSSLEKLMTVPFDKTPLGIKIAWLLSLFIWVLKT